MKYVFFMLLLMPAFAYASHINEIMYNPEGTDTNSEWVEIYSPEFVDFTNWTIGDSNLNITILPFSIKNSSYSLIVSNNSNFFGNNSNFSIYFAGTKIGNGLNNDGDAIFLYDENKTLIANASYVSDFANGNNKTLEFYNGIFYESLFDGGTPGYENSIILFFENSSNISVNVTSNFTNTTTETNKTNDVCYAFLEINTTKQIYEDEAIKFKHIINSSSDNFSITYWVEDLFGEVVKSKYETRTLTQKSFTPHPSERDTVYVIKSEINTECADASAEKLVIYKTNEIFEEDEAEEENEAEAEKTENKTKFSYGIISYEENISQNSEARAIVEIKSDDEPHLIKIESYIYRGSKKYSDIFNYTFTIGKKETEAVEVLVFTNASPGEYKLKVKINKDNQKTDYEITENITVTESEEGYEEQMVEDENEESDEVKEYAKSKTVTNTTAPVIIYESAQSESRQFIPIAIIAVLAVLSAVLVWKR
ncbi:lamin tail domain-containing protein [Candidatus Woesearchaeota archaeon]|nr:lamin tail domain-containing protein [Candidatus Woesearchaeota archaeon]